MDGIGRPYGDSTNLRKMLAYRPCFRPRFQRAWQLISTSLFNLLGHFVAKKRCETSKPPEKHLVQRFHETDHIGRNPSFVVPRRPLGRAFGATDGRLREAVANRNPGTTDTNYQITGELQSAVDRIA